MRIFLLFFFLLNPVFSFAKEENNVSFPEGTFNQLTDRYSANQLSMGPIKWKNCYPFKLNSLGTVNGQEKKADSSFRYNVSISFSLLVKMKIEQPIHKKFTCGSILQVHTSQIQPGIKLSPFLRYYPFGVFNKFYFQARGGFGYHRINMIYSTDPTSPGYIRYQLSDKEKSFKSAAIGGGFDIGVQFFLNKKRQGIVDISIGFNYYPFPKKIPLTIDQGNTTYYTSNHYYTDTGLDYRAHLIGKGKWYSPFGGAGSYLYHFVSLGFMF